MSLYGLAGLSITKESELSMIQRVAIIGAGRFAEVMLDVMTMPEERDAGVEVVASHRRSDRRAELRERYDITVYADNREACHGADVVYPLVRPTQMTALMEEIGPVITDDQFVAAGAATLPMSFYRRFLPSRCTLSWVFPTPFMRQRSGFLALCPEPDANPDRIADLRAFWERFCDQIITIDERAMDTFVLLHAAGLTFLWPIMKAYVEFGAANGFTRDQAQAITLSTFVNGGHWMEQNDSSPMGIEGMMEEFSVPGSLTAAGLSVLRRNFVESLYAQTLEAGKSQALANKENAG